MKNVAKPLLYAGAGALVIMFVLFWFLFFFPSQSSAAEGVARTQPTSVLQDTPALEMHIANNGMVLLRSARVLAVNGKTITVSTTWGSVDFTWLVLTDASSYETHQFGTRFINRDGSKISLNDIQLGDFVTITGMLGGTAQAPTIDADAVRSLR